MKLSLERKITLVILIGLLVAVLLGGAGYMTVNRLQHGAEMIGVFVATLVAYVAAVIFTCIAVGREMKHRRATERNLRNSEARLRLIADNIPALVTYIGRDERYSFVNSFLGDIGGRQSQQMLGRTMREVCTPALYADYQPHVHRVLNGERTQFEGQVVVDGKTYHHETHYVPHTDAEMGVLGFYAMSFDITVRKNAQDALFREHERLDVTLSSIGDAVITCDHAGCITFINPAAEQMTGWACIEATGRPLEHVFNVVNAKTRNKTPNPLEQAIRENRTVGLESNTVLIRRDNKEVGIDDSAAPIHDRAGNVIGGVLVFHDVSEARYLADRLEHQAHHDALTNLPNRVLFMDRLTHELSRAARDHEQVALLFMDLDKFKAANDVFGHAAGDSLLKQMAERISANLRASDSAARLGGDEFVALLPKADDTIGIARVAEKLRAAISAPYMIEGNEVLIDVSIGISLYPGDALDAETLMKNADLAMYEAKTHSQHKFQFYSQAINKRATARFNIEAQLRRALANDEFVLHYQPKVDFPSNIVVGAEALLRLPTTNGDMISPAEFIPLAEETGLIVPIGQWVLREACSQIAIWQRMGLSVPVSINVSALQLKKADFVEDVARAVEVSCIAPHLLELELTESVLLEAGEMALSCMYELLKIGVKFSIDDFGTGYSSLSYLNRIPAASLKIDRSFVADVDTKPATAMITRAIINLAENLHLGVIAEGVETAAQAQALYAQGCSIMQGFHFHRPISARCMTDLLANWKTELQSAASAEISN
jgi:diguanylate cyclase (GGDEF)-like protein/PAS domain S-box-containing protein